MTIAEAMRKCDNGKIYRPTATEPFFVHHGTFGLFLDTMCEALWIEDMEATDWEVYKETL